MSARPSSEEEEESATVGGPRLEVGIYQIVSDDTLARNRTDGNGWDWCWAEHRREWMEATPQKYAYRCLPLTILNQTGLWVKNPAGFTATWRPSRGDVVELAFDPGGEMFATYVSSLFGSGIITWNTPFLFRTRPRGSRLLILPPTNGLKPGAQGLSALVESDWISMSFTMNWRLSRPDEPVRFERGEPIFQAIPLARNPCADIEASEVVYRRLDDDKAIAESYHAWDASRRALHEARKRGEATDWQKHYFRGVQFSGEEAPTVHFTKVNAPEIQYLQGKPAEARDAGLGPQASGLGGKTSQGVSAEVRIDGGSTEEAEDPLRGSILRPEARGPRPASLDARAIAAQERAALAAERAAAARTRAAAANEASAAAVAGVAGFGGLRLRAWRLGDRAAHLAPAAAPGGVDGARSLGWLVHSPVALDASFLAARRFEWCLLESDGDGAAAALLEREGAAPAPPRVDLAAASEGVLGLFTGLILETPPGWALEVRPAPTAPGEEPAFEALADLLPTDAGPRELTLRLRFRPGARAELRPAAARGRPLAQLVPIARGAFESEWLLGQMPLEAAKDAPELVRRWSAARARER